MSADEPNETVPSTNPSNGVAQELPRLTEARKNFREKVHNFVVAFNNLPEAVEIRDGNGQEAYQGLQSFLANSALPKRYQEKKTLEQMQILQSLYASLVKMNKDKLLLNEAQKAKADEVTNALAGKVKEAETANEEFDEAYKEDQIKNHTKPLGFVDGQDLYRYAEKDQMGKELFTVMATKNTPEAFEAALKDYADSADDKGNSRRFSNINFTNPPVDENKLRSNWQYKDNVHNQVITALKAGLYPENDIRKLMGALVGPSLNARANWSSEATKKEKQIQQLKEAIKDFKDEKEGKGPKEKSSITAEMKAEKNANLSKNDKTAKNDANNSVSLTMSSGPGKSG